MSSLIIRFANDILIKVGMSGFIDYLMLFELEFQLGQTKSAKAGRSNKESSPFLRA
mgnify:CR=1 FL=1